MGRLVPFLGILILHAHSAQNANGVVIQAVVDLDDASENLIGNLIAKVDHLIDPKIIDSNNATHELAYALLRIGPQMFISGNISDGLSTISISFSAKAGVELTSEIVEENGAQSFSWFKSSGGVLQPIVSEIDNFLQSCFGVLFHCALSHFVGNLMSQTALHSSSITFD